MFLVWRIAISVAVNHGLCCESPQGPVASHDQPRSISMEFHCLGMSQNRVLILHMSSITAMPILRFFLTAEARNSGWSIPATSQLPVQNRSNIKWSYKSINDKPKPTATVKNHDRKHNSKQNKKLNKQKQDSTCSDGETLNDESIKSKVKKNKRNKSSQKGSLRLV
ncbi:hypothetical protein KIW84_065561 [Lathyrus oleraceus]|uniref:Uncharacterized protein n=1 Tax=Pisum sativum TaxID=3888 RepID=A0A9D4WHI3_PEA|nr:hypothetical protein KIW84_065561 [Pisum sativum]